MASELISKIDERGSLRILLVLEEGQKNLTEILTIVTKLGVGQRSMYLALEDLKRVGFISESDVKYSRVRLFKLTKKGKKAVEHLREVALLIDE